jgi:hypothetical protein
MTLGGCIFAEKRVSEFNDSVRRRNRALERARQAWSEEAEIREMAEKRAGGIGGGKAVMEGREAAAGAGPMK